MSLTVILPTLNEEGNIAPLIERIWKSLPNTPIIVVDDQSSDKTVEKAEAMAALGPVKVIQRSSRPCLTDSIQAGIDASQTEFVAWMDADLSHPPELLPTLLKNALTSGCSIASRFIPGAGTESSKKSDSHSTPDYFLATFLSVVLNIVARFWLRLSVTDYTSGFIVCRKSLLKDHRLVGDYGEYFIELMYFLSQSGTEISEVPYTSPARTWGESKTGTRLSTLIRRGIKYLVLALRIRTPRRLSPHWSLKSDGAFSSKAQQLAELHRELLPWTASSKSGIPTLKRMYRAVENDPHSVSILTVNGFATGTVHLGATQKRVQKNLTFGQTLKLVLRHLIQPQHLLAQRFWSRKIPQKKVGYILTLGARTQGREVLEQLESELIQKGAQSLWVDTELNNPRALRFYVKNGYQRVDQGLGQVLLAKSIGNSLPARINLERWSNRWAFTFFALALAFVVYRIKHALGDLSPFFDEDLYNDAARNLLTLGRYQTPEYPIPFHPAITNGILFTWPAGLLEALGAPREGARWGSIVWNLSLISSFFYFTYRHYRSKVSLARALLAGGVVGAVIVQLPYWWGFLQNLGELPTAILSGFGFFYLRKHPYRVLAYWSLLAWQGKFFFLPLLFLVGGLFIVSEAIKNKSPLSAWFKMGWIPILAVWPFFATGALIAMIYDAATFQSWASHWAGLLLRTLTGKLVGSPNVYGLQNRMTTLEWSTYSFGTRAKILGLWVLPNLLFLKSYGSWRKSNSFWILTGLLAAITVNELYYFYLNPWMWARYLLPALYFSAALCVWFFLAKPSVLDSSAKKTALFFEVIHPFNWPLAMAYRLLGYEVWYWKSKWMRHSLLEHFQLMDTMDYFDADSWQKVSEDAFEDWAKWSRAYFPKLKFQIRSRGISVPLETYWLQRAAMYFWDRYMFIQMVGRWAQQKPGSKILIAESAFSKHLGKNGYKHSFKEEYSRQFINPTLDSIFALVLGVATLLRELKQFSIKLPAEFKSLTAQYLFTGNSIHEMATGPDQLDFSFLCQRKLLDPSHALFFVPKTVRPENRLWLKNSKVQTFPENKCPALVAQDDRVKLIFDWIKSILSVAINSRIGLVFHELPSLLVQMQTWSYLEKRLKPRAFIGNTSSCWPELPAVPLMNALNVKTINWFYSANLSGFVVDRTHTKDLKTILSVVCSKETWTWNKACSDFLNDRNVLPEHVRGNVSEIGPMMCGDISLRNQSSTQVRQYLAPSRQNGIIESGCIISVFEVPVYSAASRRRRGHVPNFYTPEMAEQFYLDLIAALERFPEVSLLIKPKRSPIKNQNDPEYLKNLERLKDPEGPFVKSGRVILVPQYIDPYIPILAGDISIGLPFTSPVMAAITFGKLGIYHDPLLIVNGCRDPKLLSLVTRGREALFERIDRHLKNKLVLGQDLLTPTEIEYLCGPNIDSGIEFAKRVGIRTLHSEH